MLTRLPHRVGLQAPSRTTISGGAYTISWTTSATIWANVQSTKQSETYAQEKDQADITHRVIIRNRTIDNSYRFLFGSRILHIESVTDPTERDRMIKCLCREEVGN